MIRQIIKPSLQDYTIHIPKEYLHKKIEILVLPLGENNIGKSKRKTIDFISKTAGILVKRNIDPISWQRKIRDEWEDRL